MSLFDQIEMERSKEEARVERRRLREAKRARIQWDNNNERLTRAFGRHAFDVDRKEAIARAIAKFGGNYWVELDGTKPNGNLLTRAWDRMIATLNLDICATNELGVGAWKIVPPTESQIKQNKLFEIFTQKMQEEGFDVAISDISQTSVEIHLIEHVWG